MLPPPAGSWAVTAWPAWSASRTGCDSLISAGRPLADLYFQHCLRILADAWTGAETEDGLIDPSVTLCKEILVPPTPPDNLAPEMAAVAARLGLRDVTVLRRSGKTLLSAGDLAGRPVVVKLLLDGSEFWQARWRHEIGIYRAFAQEPPPVRVPALIHTDGVRLLVLERLDARPLDTERYPGRRLTTGQIEPCLAALRRLSAWRPASGQLAPVWDYPVRVSRYHAAGYLTDADRDALQRLLATCDQAVQICHGDPLPSNLLLFADGGCALIDWEFTGTFLPGFDLAMLHTLLGASTPAARTWIDQTVADAGTEEPFAVNLALVLTRELRIHRELPDSPMRTRRLELLDAAWARARERLHAAARKRKA
jgi:Phosphotransferase enzyme family